MGPVTCLKVLANDPVFEEVITMKSHRWVSVLLFLIFVIGVFPIFSHPANAADADRKTLTDLLTELEQEIEKATELLKLVHLDGKENELCDNLAYGEHKLLALARVLATGAEFVMLDEPVSGLPPGSVDEVLEVIKDLVTQGKTILLVEHNMEAAMGICDWIFVLNFGELLTSGTPDEIRKHEEVIRVYLGV